MNFVSKTTQNLPNIPPPNSHQNPNELIVLEGDEIFFHIFYISLGAFDSGIILKPFSYKPKLLMSN